MVKRATGFLLACLLPACNVNLNRPTGVAGHINDGIRFEPHIPYETRVRIGESLDVRAVPRKTCFDRMRWTFRPSVTLTDVRCEGAAECVVGPVTPFGGLSNTITVDYRDAAAVSARVVGVATDPSMYDRSPISVEVYSSDWTVSPSCGDSDTVLWLVVMP